jgi:hypothetical protein
VIEKYAGDDEPQTRDLCRDSAPGTCNFDRVPGLARTENNKKSLKGILIVPGLFLPKQLLGAPLSA